jgi:hypothetical protein
MVVATTMPGNTTLAFKALLLFREYPHAPSSDGSILAAIAMTCPLESGAGNYRDSQQPGSNGR